MRKLLTILTVASTLSLSGCGYNTFQTTDEQIRASWSEVVNQYQRRADVIPNLVNTVKGEAKFEQAQGELTGALSKLMVVSESYPNLRANQGFRDLQAQLEGTENRITVARNRYIKSVRDCNVTVRSFPSNLTGVLLASAFPSQVLRHGHIPVAA